MSPALSRIKIETRQKLNTTCTRLWLVPFVTRSNRMYAELDQNSLRLNQNLTRQIEDKKKQLNGIDRLRETLGYRETLRRGYSVVRDGVDVVTSVGQAKSAKFLEVEFVDGRVSFGESLTLTTPTSPSKRRKPKPPEQGQLL